MSALAEAGGTAAALGAPFRGPAADSRLGELLVDVLPLACAVGNALDLSHCIALCGTTWRRGDRGATNDMMVQSLRLQAPWLAEARARPRDAAWWRTALIRAADGGNEQRVRELVAAGANANGVSGLLQSALHCASWRGHARVALALLEGKFESEGGALANLQDCYGASALMRAAWHGHEEVVRLLLSRGADQTQQSKRGGRCAMHRAAYTGRSGVVALLCAAPGAAAARALRDRDGKTPLDVAVEHGRAACAAVLRGGE